jgi:hypothetical protein
VCTGILALLAITFAVAGVFLYTFIETKLREGIVESIVVDSKVFDFWFVIPMSNVRFCRIIHRTIHGEPT